MSVDVLDPKRGVPQIRRPPIIANGVLGMLVFVVVEIMFFAGLVSAFLIVKSRAPGGFWPPPDQPRLPAEATLINTILLLMSGVALVYAHRAHAKDAKLVKAPLAMSIALGAYFVAAQGSEWVALLAQGLTLTSSTHGSFFYMIVGTHGLHAVVALVAMGYALVRAWRGTMSASTLHAVEVFWYFVVLVWPVLYWQVYL
jgi:heme/copper-type cytochrome/quinol oxidase subunit 3